MSSDNGKVLEQSVTQNDVAKYVGAGVVQFLVPAFGGAYLVGDALPPELPSINSMTPYSKARDTILVMTPRVEGNWASALNIAMSKVISRGIQFESPVERRVEAMNAMFRTCDGRRGFPSYLERHLQDYFTCSNGAWTEIERVSRNPGAKIVSFHHLDSLRVWRTGDPDIPAVYWDLRGGYHELKWWECFNVTAMESSRAGFWYGGECASERAYRDIRAVAAMTTYFDEKITGGGYTEIEFVPGVTIEQLNDAKKTATSDQAAKGIVYFQGKLVIPYWGDNKLEGYKVQLKGLPDDWKRQEELDIRLLNYANTLGISPNEIDPRLMARGAMGVGHQAQILDENEQGRGSGSWEQKWLNAVNNLITPEATTALLVTKDLRDEKAKADIRQVNSQAILNYVKAGVLNGATGLYVSIDDGDLPRELASENAPVESTLSDEQKPMSESEEAAFTTHSAQHIQALTQQTPSQAQPTQTKETSVYGVWRSVNFERPRFVPFVPDVVRAKEIKLDPAKQLIEEETAKARALVMQVKHA